MNPLVNLLAGPFVEMAGKIIDRVIPDKAAAEKAKMELAAVGQSQQFQVDMQQILVNLEEAKNPNLFVSGWRPFVGWASGVAFIYATLLEPLMRFVAVVLFDYEGVFPEIELGVVISTLGGLLGLGTLRTYEKQQGVASK